MRTVLPLIEKKNLKWVYFVFHHVTQNNFLWKFNRHKKYIQKKICKTVAWAKRKAYCKEIFRMLIVPNFKGYTILLTLHLKSSFSHGTKVLLRQWYETDFFCISGSLVVPPAHHLNMNKTNSNYILAHSLDSVEEFVSIKNILSSDRACKNSDGSMIYFLFVLTVNRNLLSIYMFLLLLLPLIPS
jgi:hypothetical protein